jgi:uncharacterized protein YecT (DUF1311 family)
MIRPICLILLCLAAPAAAQEVDCDNAITQADMNQCAYQDLDAADAELNRAYGQAMTLLKEWDADLPAAEQGGAEQGGADALREAQRLWISFRDKACEVEGYPMKGGSAEPLLVYGCMRVLTEERTAHLQGLVDAFGG